MSPPSHLPILPPSMYERSDGRTLGDALADGKTALDAWRLRMALLPYDRRADRADTARIVRRWEEHVRELEQEQYGPSLARLYMNVFTPDADLTLRQLSALVGWASLTFVLALVALALAVASAWPELRLAF
jgi:hypothetical protein